MAQVTIGKSELYEVINNGDYGTLNKYEHCDVYAFTPSGILDLVKTKTDPLNCVSLKEADGSLTRLYVKLTDRIALIRGRQSQLNSDLKDSLHINVPKAKRIITELIDVTFSEPRTEILYGIKDTVDIFVKEYLDNPEVLQHLVRTSIHDYSTSLHLTNVMLFAFGYAQNVGMPEHLMKDLGLAALMHDIGKNDIPDYILQAARKLTDEEFNLIKTHPRSSHTKLRKSGFNKVVAKAAIEHHEKLDGSGYPYGISSISQMGRELAVIDIFEALTNWRPYKKELSALDALKLMKEEEVDRGKIDYDVFKSFAQSLVGMKISSKGKLDKI